MKTGDHCLRLDSCGWDDRDKPLFYAYCSCGKWRDLSGLSREHARSAHGAHFHEVNEAEQAKRGAA